MELLPCPFCGSNNLGFAQGSTHRWLSVICHDCGAASGEVRKEILCSEFTVGDKQRATEEWNRRTSPASVPEGWKHSCNALCLDSVELWIPQCPHCGKPAPTPPVSEDKDKIIAAANALENIASTSSSTRIRRVANDALTAIRARRNHG